MDIKEKLVELLGTVVSPNELLCCGEVTVSPSRVADHLIANGVTFAKDINVPNKWISVEERLPDTECLAVSMLTGPAYKEMLVGYVAETSNWDTGYKCESDGEILPNVTHWMPLPPAPEGE